MSYEKARHAVEQHVSVREAAVFDAGARHVVAVVPHAFASPAEIRATAWASGSLAEVPLVVLAERFPRRPDGGLDVEALLARATATENLHDYEPASGPLETALVTRLEALVEVAPIGVTDDFFDIGVNSLSALELLAHIEDVTGAVVDVADFFDAGSVRALAARLPAEVKSAG